MLPRLVKMPKTSAKSTRTKAKSKRKATADPAETASEVPVVDMKCERKFCLSLPRTTLLCRTLKTF